MITGCTGLIQPSHGTTADRAIDYKIAVIVMDAGAVTMKASPLTQTSEINVALLRVNQYS